MPEVQLCASCDIQRNVCTETCLSQDCNHPRWTVDLHDIITHCANQPLFFSAADDAAYIFPGSRDFATLGSFDKNGLLIRGQKVSYRIEGCDVRGLLKLKFSEPSEPKVFYHYLPAKKDDFGDQPHIVDEVAEEYIEVRHINDYEVRILF